MLRVQNRMTVTLRSDGRPVILLNNDDLLKQVMSNRRARKMLGEKASNILLLNGIVGRETVQIEQSALLVRSFVCESVNERAAICLAEQLVTNAIQFRVNDPVFAHNELAYADELLWLTWTGNMRYDFDRIDHGDVRMYDFIRIPAAEPRGTWNTYEPELI